jgi:Uma2 family endonuclease
MQRMGNPAIDRSDRFTYRHYKTWPDEERWELIEGQAWNMSPAPSTRHQDIQAQLITALRNLLKGKSCKAFDAPFDVLLPRAGEADDEVDTVVQPDIVVYCDKSKLQKNGARGAPDLIMEILSPRTSRRDQNEKFRLYEKHGVREYWVVDPGNQSIWVWRLKAEGGYDEGELRDLLRDDSPILSKALEGFVVDPKELFAELD